MSTQTQGSASDKNKGAKSFFLDPFKIWRQAFEVSEQAFGTAMERALNTTQFAEANGKLMEAILLTMKAARGNVKTFLHTLNFPSREDTARLGQLIIALEEKVDQLHDRMDQLEVQLAEALSALKAQAQAQAKSEAEVEAPRAGKK
jgi:polyhydroxyalkanoic acid synthase PhaR subunit